MKVAARCLRSSWRSSLSRRARSAANGALTLRGYGTAVVDGDARARRVGPAPAAYDFQANRCAYRGRRDRARVVLRHERRDESLPRAARRGRRTSATAPSTAIFLAPGRTRSAREATSSERVPTDFEDMPLPPDVAVRVGAGWPTSADGGTQDGTSDVADARRVHRLRGLAPVRTAPTTCTTSASRSRAHRTFVGSFQHCRRLVRGTTITPSRVRQIVVVSGTHVPPNTSITAGPRGRRGSVATSGRSSSPGPTTSLRRAS